MMQSISPLEPSTPRPSASQRIGLLTLALVAVLCTLAIAYVYYGRLGSLPDLYRKDQNKTMAYTVDMVLHGRFSLPRDVLFQPATKPPLYNWFAALLVGPTGIYSEWAQKWPSIASSFAIAVALAVWCRRQFAQRLGADHAWIVGLLAAAIWISTKSTALLLYIARPDMLQALCLILAWMAGTVTLGRATRREAFWPMVGFWLATSAAALAKGPAAVYPILYVLLAAKLSFNDFGRLRNFRWIPGLIWLFGTTGVWLACAYRQDPQHVKSVLIGTEVVKRIAASNPEGFVKPVYFSVMWFFTQNPYWSIVALFVVGLFAIGALVRRDVDVATRDGTRAAFDPVGAIGRFFGGPLGAPVLWLVVVLGCLSIPKDKRMDFLLPTYPAVAIIVAYGAVSMLARGGWVRIALPVIVAAYVGYDFVGKDILKSIAGAIDPWIRANWKMPAAGVLLVGLIAACSVGLAVLLLATRRWVRLEFVVLAVGVLYWSSVIVQGVYRDNGAPGRTNPSVHAASFAKRASAIVGDAKVVSLIKSKHPILTLMGRHHGSNLTRKDFEEAEYVIIETTKLRGMDMDPLVRSGRLPVDYGSLSNDSSARRGIIGLYKIEKTPEGQKPSVDGMISIFRWVANWTDRDANPYRSPNTVWIDEPNQPPMWKPTRTDPWFKAPPKAERRKK